MAYSEDGAGHRLITVILPVAFAPEESLPGAREWARPDSVRDVSGQNPDRIFLSDRILPAGRARDEEDSQGKDDSKGRSRDDKLLSHVHYAG